MYFPSVENRSSVFLVSRHVGTLSLVKIKQIICCSCSFILNRHIRVVSFFLSNSLQKKFKIIIPRMSNFSRQWFLTVTLTAAAHVASALTGK